MEVAVHDGGGSGGYYKRMPAGPDPGEASDGEAPPPLLSAPPAANGGGGGGHATSSSAPAPSAGVGAWVVFRRIWSLLAVQFVVAGLAYGVLPAVLPVAVTGYRDAAHVLQYSSAYGFGFGFWLSLSIDFSRSDQPAADPPRSSIHRRRLRLHVHGPPRALWDALCSSLPPGPALLPG